LLEINCIYDIFNIILENKILINIKMECVDTHKYKNLVSYDIMNIKDEKKKNKSPKFNERNVF